MSEPEVNKLYIMVRGCDDATNALVELNDDELKILKRVVESINAKSRYSCQPRIDITKQKPADWHEPANQVNDD